jgi:two-component system, cell cycle sensor histidine kinase and response regulator CckA
MKEKKYKVLYVEDNKFDQKAFKRFIDKNNLPYDIYTADSVTACKKLLETKSFDIILQDFRLKDGDAFDVLKLKTDEPVVIITGLGNEETAVKSMKENAYDYIIKDTKGNYLKVLPSTIKNVIKRKETEEQLKLIRYSIDNASESTMLLSTSGEILFANQSTFMNSGYTKEKVSSMNWSEIIPEMTRDKMKDFVESIKDKKIIKFESSYRRKDGTTFPVDVLANYQVFGKKEYIFVFVHDITEQKKIEEERQKIHKLESISILAGGIAHDFNNFLSAIIGNISLAILEAGDNEELIKILNEAKEAKNLAKNLTKQLLTFSTGGLPIIEETSIANVIKETAEFNLRGSNVKCFYTIPENIWKVQADRNQLSQVISNLIINADQAMPEGGIIKVNLTNKLIKEEDTLPLKEGKYVKITIEDNGLGIAKKHLSRIFDPYFTTKQKGSGLGLATTFSIIEKHNGYIMVDSKLGSGTTFSVYLPATTEKETKQSNSTKEESGSNNRKEGKILLMDDEKIVRKALKKILETLGFKVEPVKEGKEALLKYKENLKNKQPFDVVILDLTVPGGMGGKETIKKLLEIDPNVKALVSSGYSNDPVMAKYKDYGFKGIIVKPYDASALSEAVGKLLEES